MLTVSLCSVTISFLNKLRNIKKDGDLLFVQNRSTRKDSMNMMMADATLPLALLNYPLSSHRPMLIILEGTLSLLRPTSKSNTNELI